MKKPIDSQTRREFLSSAAEIASLTGGLLFFESSTLAAPPPDSGCLTDVEGIKVGHYTETRRPTGCTVILTEGGAVAGVDVRGSAPGTHETDLLSPLNTVEKIHAVVLSGGSAFGLETAAGVMQYLEEQRIGYQTRVARIPIVPAAVLFDLGLGDARIRPDKRSGYLACKAAKARACEEGNVGAGTGATVGKMFGMDRAMKGGLGAASIQVGPVTVAALVAVNALGDVLDAATGVVLAGARTPDGKSLVNSLEQMRQGRYSPPKAGENTTIGVVATNAVLNKSEAAKMAQMAHDGLARSINPVHTPHDGDTLFAISTGTATTPTTLTLLGSLAADVVAQAVRRAIVRAKGLPGLPSHLDLASSQKRG
ncbi:MAG TPA: P1 family peptidase [Terriglobia bacterium]|nr:P1 family peptidase [Terriglobia bacterium]